MLDEIYKNLTLQYGALGLLVATLFLGNVIQWKQRIKEQEGMAKEREAFGKERADYGEIVRGFISVLVEINVFVRAKMK